MDRRQLLFGMTALAVGSPSLNDLLTAQSIETANQSIIEGSGDRTSFQYARPLPILITSLIIMACLIPVGTRNNRKKTGKEFKLCVNHSFIA